MKCKAYKCRADRCDSRIWCVQHGTEYDAEAARTGGATILIPHFDADGTLTHIERIKP